MRHQWIFAHAALVVALLYGYIEYWTCGASVITAGYAQSNDSTTNHRLTLQGDVERTDFPVHKDVFAKPCLKYEAISRAHVTNPDTYDHIVSVTNHCRQPIKIHLSYEKSERFIELDIPADDRKEVLLGIFPRIRLFHYQSKEIF